MGELRSLGREDVLHDQVVEPAEQAHGPRLVGFAARRVLTHDVSGSQLAMLHRLEHLAEVVALFLGKLRAVPRASELLVDARIGQVLESGEARRDGAHVTAALNVVLTSQGVEAAAIAADLPGEECEVDQRQHVVGGVVMLGDAEGPADHRPVGLRVFDRDVLDRRGGHPGLLLRDVQRVRLDAAREIAIPGGRALDELHVR